MLRAWLRLLTVEAKHLMPVETVIDTLQPVVVGAAAESASDGYLKDAVVHQWSEAVKILVTDDKASEILEGEECTVRQEEETNVVMGVAHHPREEEDMAVGETAASAETVEILVRQMFQDGVGAIVGMQEHLCGLVVGDVMGQVPHVWAAAIAEINGAVRGHPLRHQRAEVMPAVAVLAHIHLAVAVVIVAATTAEVARRRIPLEAVVHSPLLVQLWAAGEQTVATMVDVGEVMTAVVVA